MTDDSTYWTVHGSRRMYSSDWVNLDLDDVEVPGGPRFEHHVLRFPRASVGALVLDEDRVLLLWRHRFTTGVWGWEIPAGWSENGEEPAETARREVLEETGYRLTAVEPLLTYNSMPGISSHAYPVFLGTGAELVGEREEAEASRVEWVPLEQVRELMAQGQIPDGHSLTALAYYLAVRRA